MDEKIVSSEELASSVLSLSELSSYLTFIIKEIRSQPNAGIKLKAKLLELSNYQNIIDKNSSISTLFNAYKKIQETSMEIRKLLSNFISLEVYDSINYAFYYNGQRYYTDEIKAEWLTKSKSSGELQLRLNAATNDLKEEVSDVLQQQVTEAFNKHYAIFLAAISGTYRGIIGRGGAVNKGHVAEAYEIHTEEHHPVAYRIINRLARSSDILTTADKALIAYQMDTDAVSYWANHEDINTAWQHIRDALGMQRGTVAGDVKGIQVKQGKTGAHKIRLARLNTLIEGVNAYSAILDSTKTPEEVAIRIANYISEPVRQMSEKIINNIGNEKIQDIMKAMNENIKINKVVRL